MGEYFAIFNLSQFVILFVSAVGMLLFPTISEFHAQNNMEAAKALVLKSERYLSMIMFPIIIIMVVLAEPVIHILISDQYMSALPVLQILPFFVLFEALSLPYTSRLQGMDMPKLVRNRVFIMMICNVSLNLILIPREIKSFGMELPGLGAQGAALATVIAFIIGLVYIRFVTWSITGIKGNIRIILHVIAAAVMGVILIYLSKVIFIDRWYELLTIAGCGFILYFTLLSIMKEFRNDDFVFFADVLNIKKMFEYVKEEVKGR